jgi:hypothetical protein
MTQHTEATQAWLGQITHQMIMMSYQNQNRHLRGPIGGLKSFTTPCAREMADGTCNVFGGRGVAQGGIVIAVKQLCRTYEFDAILGGEESRSSRQGCRANFELLHPTSTHIAVISLSFCLAAVMPPPYCANFLLYYCLMMYKRLHEANQYMSYRVYHETPELTRNHSKKLD